MPAGEAREDKVADDATKRAANGCLAVEKRQAPAKLEAGVKEGEVGHGDGVEAGYRTLAPDALSKQSRSMSGAYLPNTR